MSLFFNPLLRYGFQKKFSVNNGFTYAANNWHSFTENYDVVTTRSLDANFLIGYQVWVKQDVIINKIAARYTAGIAGSSVVGLYTTNINGTPNSLVLQSPVPFNNAVTGVQNVTLAPSFNLSAGVYWVLYLSSSTPTSAALNQNTLTNSSGWNSAMTVTNDVWFRSLSYTATLPTIAGTGAFGNYTVVPFFTFFTI